MDHQADQSSNNQLLSLIQTGSETVVETSFAVDGSTPGAELLESFPKLPIEIRHMIWWATFAERRLHVWLPNTGKCCSSIARSKPPMALFINHESRAIALNFFDRLELVDVSKCPNPMSARYIFLKLTYDVFRISLPKFYELFTSHFKSPYYPFVGKIRHLEVEVPRGIMRSSSDTIIWNYSLKFPHPMSLQDLLLIPRPITYRDRQSDFQRTDETDAAFIQKQKRLFEIRADMHPGSTIPKVSMVPDI